MTREEWTATSSCAKKTWQELAQTKTQSVDNQLFTRFVSYYEFLHRLPRRIRRILSRKATVSLAGAALLLALGQKEALTATFTASNPAELIAAINQANDESTNPGLDTIELTANILINAADNSIYGPTALPVVASMITIEGDGHTIERDAGTDEFRLFAVSTTGNLILNETTVSGGVAPGSGFPERLGGGIFSYGTLELSSSVVAGNSASAGGGGISNTYGKLTLVNSTVSGNSAVSGGGIDSYRGDVAIKESTVSDNSVSEDGGGINQSEGDLIVRNSTVSGNSAASYGGGIRHYGSAITIVHSTFSGNTADLGGAVYNQRSSHLTLRNSTVSGNSAMSAGGGLHNGGILSIANSTVNANSANNGGALYNRDHASITNSTVAANSAANRGGGLSNTYAGSLNIVNTILASNNAAVNGPNCQGSVSSLGHNLADDTSCGLSTTGDQQNADPGLGPFAANGPGRGHFPLLPDSEAIDMADDTACSLVDQLGEARMDIPGIGNSACDIGAVEFREPSATALDVDSNGQVDALTDGILILRFLFEFTGETLTDGSVVAPDCTRCTPEEIEAFLEALGR